jgi:hypothetical protein
VKIVSSIKHTYSLRLLGKKPLMQTPSPRVFNNGISSTTIIRSQSSAYSSAAGVPSTSMTSASMSQPSSQRNTMFRTYGDMNDVPNANFSTSASTVSSSKGISESSSQKKRPTPLRVSSMMNPDDLPERINETSVDLSMNEVCIFNAIRLI